MPSQRGRHLEFSSSGDGLLVPLGLVYTKLGADFRSVRGTESSYIMLGPPLKTVPLRYSAEMSSMSFGGPTSAKGFKARIVSKLQRCDFLVSRLYLLVCRPNPISTIKVGTPLFVGLLPPFSTETSTGTRFTNFRSDVFQEDH